MSIFLFRSIHAIKPPYLAWRHHLHLYHFLLGRTSKCVSITLGKIEDTISYKHFLFSFSQQGSSKHQLEASNFKEAICHILYYSFTWPRQYQKSITSCKMKTRAFKSLHIGKQDKDLLSKRNQLKCVFHIYIPE